MIKSEGLALFIGMFVGDGSLPIKHNGEGYRNYVVSFYNTSYRHAALFKYLFRHIFGIKAKIFCRKKDGKKPLWICEKYSKNLALIINQDFEVPFGKKSIIVTIPTIIKKADVNIKRYFIFGLLITDGSIRKNKTIIFHSASRNLLEDLQEMMYQIWGIKKKVRAYQQGIFKSYQLSLNMSESQLLIKDMPPWHNLVLRGS